MIDLETASYPLAFASEVAGLTAPTGRSWVQKGWIYADKRAAKPGSAALLTGRSVLALAIAAQLARLGLHPHAACQAARRFTDFPHWDGGMAGELYEGLGTTLVVYPSGEAAVLSADMGATLMEVFFPTATQQASYEAAYVLKLNRLVKAVEVALIGRDAGAAD